jgi:hypothetical protein
VALAGRQAPLGIERQADVRLDQELLVPLRLREEIGVAGLEVEDDVDALGRRCFDPRADVVERALGGEVAVRAGVGGSHSRDDLDDGHDRLGADVLVGRGVLVGPVDRRVDRLLAEDAEVGVAGMAVDRDEPTAGEHDLASARELGAAECRVDEAGDGLGRGEHGPPPDGDDLGRLELGERGPGVLCARIAAV